MQAVKMVRQKHQTPANLLWLLDEFRCMVNVCIAIGIEENVSSLKTLSLRSYHRLSRDNLSYHRLCAISAATGILRNYRKAKRKNPRTRVPYAKKLMLTTCYGFEITDDLLRLPVQPRHHDESQRIVEDAKTRQPGIVMERLTGIRRLYRRGNRQSRSYRARMHSWSFGELQRQIEYKARSEGVKVIYVPARNTSKRCSICGYKTLESTQRRLWCPHCGTILDRDENAARNIAARGLRFSPNGPLGEAMVEEREQENATLILKVDGGKLSQQTNDNPSDEDLTEPE